MQTIKYIVLLSFLSVKVGFAQITALDTIFGNFLTTDTATYSAPNGGFVSGNNGYGDSEKMQTYFYKVNKALVGALVWYSKLELNTANTQSKIGIKLRKVDSTLVNQPWLIKGPDTLIYEKYHGLSNAVTGTDLKQSLTYYPFDNILFPPPAFSVGIALDSLVAGDTLACQSTKDTISIFFRRSWEKWGTQIGTIFDNWGLNIDFAIFPVYDTLLVFSNGEKVENEYVRVFPNPAQQDLQIQSSFSFNWIKLIDMLGRSVILMDFPSTTNLTLNQLSELKNGSYILVLGLKNQLKSTQIIQIHNR